MIREGLDEFLDAAFEATLKPLWPSNKDLTEIYALQSARALELAKSLGIEVPHCHAARGA